jgi:hypothetical protein
MVSFYRSSLSKISLTSISVTCFADATKRLYCDSLARFNSLAYSAGVSVYVLIIVLPFLFHQLANFVLALSVSSKANDRVSLGYCA